MLAPPTFIQCICQFILTALTNFLIIPTLYAMYKQRLILQYYIGIFTLLCSFMYHAIDSISDTLRLYLNEKQWHRLDNVGSVMSLSSLILYVSGIPQSLQQRILSVNLIFSMFLQQWRPWNVLTGVVPVLLMLLIGILTRILGLFVKINGMKYLKHRKDLFIGFVQLIVASYFFFKGLNNKQDYLRMYHGLWHLFICIPSFTLWQLYSDRQYTIKEVMTNLSQGIINMFKRGRGNIQSLYQDYDKLKTDDDFID